MASEGLLRETKLEIFESSSPTLRVAIHRLGTLVPMDGWAVEYLQKPDRTTAMASAWVVSGSVVGTGTVTVTIPGSLTGTAGHQRWALGVTPPGAERKIVLAGELVILDL